MNPTGAIQRTVRRARNGALSFDEETLAEERPLHVVFNRRPLLTTMRTPGHDRELTLGYLLNEKVLQSAHQVLSYSPRSNDRADTLCLESRDFSEKHLQKLQRSGTSVSSCGICGRSGEIPFELPALPEELRFPLPLEHIPALLQEMRTHQKLFQFTGGIHAAGLVDKDLNLLCVREDIGRHNAIDKVIGWRAMQERLVGHRMALLTSGRVSFEVMQKASSAGIGAIIAVSAASSMAVDIARETGIALVGFVRGEKMVLYNESAPSNEEDPAPK